ncbi:hypothetical protein D3C71_1001340 [compost metagenome]
MPATTQRQGISADHVLNVIGQEQRTRMTRDVGQRFTRVVRVFQHFRVRVAIAGDHIGVLGQTARQIHFHALRTHTPGGFRHRLITDALGVKHVALVNIKQRDISGNPVEQVKLGTDFVGIGRFRRQIANVAGDRRLRHKRLRVVGEQRHLRRQLVDQARFRRPLVVAAVGIDVKRTAFPRILCVRLIAQAGHRDPFIRQIQRILHVGGITFLLDGLVAVGCRHRRTFAQIAVGRIVDIEIFNVLTADHIRAQQIVILVRHPGQDLIVKPGNIDVALQIRAGRMHALGRTLSGVHTAGQVAGGGVIGHHAGLVIRVFILAKAVVEFGGPLAVQAIFGVQLSQIGFTVGDVERLVEARFAIDIHRLLGRQIEDRPAIERGLIIAVGIEHRDGGVIAKPGQGRRDKRAALFTEITPVILFLIFTREAIGQSRAFNRVGHVELPGAATEAGGGRGDRPAELLLRALGHHVNKPARIENAIQRRRRAFQHFDALRRGVKAARQHGAQAVGHDRPVAVSPKTTAHKGILRATKRVGLDYVADVIQRFVERRSVLIFQHLIAHGIHHLRNIQHWHIGERGGGGVQWLIAIGRLCFCGSISGDGQRFAVFRGGAVCRLRHRSEEQQ